MNESARTVAYVAVAAVAAIIAWFATPSSDITPADLANKKLGQPFYPDFENPNDPTSIRVITFDEARAEARPFAVEFKDGLWTIPSHHNYPADGKTQLSKIAASTIGIKRDEFRSASKEDHEDLGVLDPLDSDSSRLKGRGQRVTLSKGDTVLADFIVGKQVRDRPGYYYVRIPSDDSTYVAKLDLNLTTKFSDWVETDLLKMNRDALTEIQIDDYAIAAEGGVARIKPGDVTRLDRDKSADPWKLDGIDEETEELDNAKVNDLLNTLTGLKLSGVRPKPKGLRADLTFDPEFIQNRLEAELVMVDMQQKGFIVGPADLKNPADKQQRLYSRQGELFSATNDGVVYTLRFGEIFSGDESEVEIGTSGDKKDDKKEGEKKDEAAEDEAKKGEKETGTGKQSSRYLFVSTRFDDKYLGDKPVEPERPEGLADDDADDKKGKDEPPKIAPLRRQPKSKSESKPDEGAKSQPDAGEAKKDGECGDDKPGAETEKPADAAEKDNDAKPADAAPAADKSAESDGKEPVKSADQSAPPAEPRPKTQPELKQEYNTLKQKYETDLKAYEDKVTAGKEKVDELNLRFGGWYYVISAENFNKLHLSRKDLVKEKTKPADDKSQPATDAAKNPAGVEANPSDKPETNPADDQPQSSDNATENPTDKPDDKAAEGDKP